jgi:hypothetical protein
MRDLFLATVLVSACCASVLGPTACDDNGGSSICSSYCATMAEVADAEDCDFGDDAESDCREDCGSVIGDMENEDRQETQECIQCVQDEAGDSPNASDWAEALNDSCEDECDNSGSDDFLGEMADQMDFFEDCEEWIIINCDEDAAQECEDDHWSCYESCDWEDSACVAACCHDGCDCLEDVYCAYDDCHDMCDEWS